LESAIQGARVALSASTPDTAGTDIL
jgi:hypothetical protein